MVSNRLKKVKPYLRVLDIQVLTKEIWFYGLWFMFYPVTWGNPSGEGILLPLYIIYTFYRILNIKP